MRALPRTAAPVLGVALLLLLGAVGASADSSSPDVIVITLDTTRADHLSCYGYFRETSPHLDALAREAIVFENAFAPMSTTLPSHLSLFTSTHTITHGVHGNVSSFHRAWEPGTEIRTAAEIFAGLGYETAGFVSAAPLKRVSGISIGFDHYREPEENECRAEETTTAVLDWLETASDRPLFLWVHYFDPHDIYSAPRPFTRFFRTDDELVAQLRANHYPRWDQLDCQHMANMYDSEIRYMDDQIGRLFDALRRSGRWDGAVLAVVGDHGEGLGQHDFIRHDPLNREQLHVPLILKLPGSDRARRSDRLTAVVDVLPTLVDVLGLSVPKEVRERFEGRNLIDTAGWDYVFSERARGRVKKLGPGEQYALTGREWKYFLATEKPDELYHVASDPFELENVIDRHPEVADRLRARILSALEHARRAGPDSAEALPPEHLEQLRALGYVD
jgi:arylsulfatase